MISPTTAIDLAAPVARIYRDAELALLAMLADKLSRGLDLSDWEQRQLGELQAIRGDATAILNAANAEAAVAIQLAMDRAYDAGELSAAADMPNGTDASTAPRPAVLALAEDTANGIVSAGPSILRGIDDAYRSIVAQAAAVSATGVIGRREATQRAINAFLGNGLRFIQTRRGRMDIVTYSEMAVRTATARGAIQGHLDGMASAGITTVVIHPGPRPCRICDRWAREVLSTDGQTGTLTLQRIDGDGTVEVRVSATLDDARAAGWSHPNCRCAIRSYLPGVTDTSVIERPEWDAEGYEAQQRQRAIERQIRAWKQREALAITPADRSQAIAQKRAWQAAQREHVASHDGLKRQSEREQIGGRFAAPAEARRRTRTAPPPRPQGRDARTMTNPERVEAARIMFGSGSPEYREARRRWG